MRHLIWLFLLGPTVLSATPKDCVKLLTGDLERISRPITARELEAARRWMKALGGGSSSVRNSERFKAFVATYNLQNESLNEDSVAVIRQRFVLDEWDRWDHDIGQVTRDAWLQLELRAMGLEDPSPRPFQFANPPDIEKQSRINLQAWLQRIENHAQGASRTSINPYYRDQIAMLARELEFHFFTSYAGEIRPPLVSDRELAKIGFGEERTFASNLRGGFLSVPLRVTASGLDLQLTQLSGLISERISRLDGNFANAQGFVAPVFRNLEDLLYFFNRFEPEALAKLVEWNRWYLPRDIRNRDDLMNIVSAKERAAHFPAISLERQMYPLISRLHKYALTPADARVFWRALFTRMLEYHADRNPTFFKSLWAAAHHQGGSQYLFHEAEKWFGSPVLGLFIPHSVPSSKLTTEILAE